VKKDYLRKRSKFMRHHVSGRKLDRSSGHRQALFRNLVTDLLRYDAITTTEAKAKEVRPIAERVITLGKNGDLSARRQTLAFVYDEKVVDKLFGELAQQYKDRQGGYVRIVKLGNRLGDGAAMARLELVK
jgi:large subunit ribosomal protein L17